jgi:hypothetical protein
LQSRILAGVVRIRVIEANASRDFHISQHLLKQQVPHFAALVNERHNPDRIVEVTDVEIETFRIFVTWLVLKESPKHKHFSPLYRNPLTGHHWTSGLPLIKVYIFACDYEIPELQDDALDRFASLILTSGGRNSTVHIMVPDIEVIPTLDEMNYVYSNTAADSPLRPIIVDAFCESDMDLDYSLMECSKEFLVDVIMRKQQTEDTWKDVMRYMGLGEEGRARKRKRVSDGRYDECDKVFRGLEGECRSLWED